MKKSLATFSLSQSIKSSTLKNILSTEFPHQYEQGCEADLIELVPDGDSFLVAQYTDLGVVVKEFYYNRYWNDNFTETYTGAQMKVAIQQWIIFNDIVVEDFDQFFREIECIIPQKMEQAVRVG